MKALSANNTLTICVDLLLNLLANADGSRLLIGNVKGAEGNNFVSAGEIRNGAVGACEGILFSISSSFPELHKYSLKKYSH